MSDIELLIGLVAATAALVSIARALDVPFPIVLLAGGLAIGLIPGVPKIELDPELVLLVFIPPLVHSSAYVASPRHLRAFARPITQMAILLVVLTMVAVAVVAHFLIDMSWGAAFVLGAILSPTDLVAATAIFRRLGVPPHLLTVIDGESLLNDGTALVAYKIAVAAVIAGGYSVLDGARELVLVSAGGILIGLVIAWLVAQARRRVEDVMTEITVTLLTPYVAFIAAEEAHASGILAAVVSGIYLGWKSPELFSPTNRIQAWSFWEVFVFLLESILFILIGLQIPGVVDRLSSVPAGELALYAAVIALVTTGVRMLFLFTIAELDEAYEGAVRHQRRKRLSRAERFVLGWSGMRGAVSLAAALAIPLTTDAGAPFPERDMILFLTLSTIGVTLVLQGLSLPALIRRLGVEDTRPGRQRRALARFDTVQAALAHVSNLSFESGMSAGVIERARGMYTSRARQLAGECRIGVEVEEGDDAAWQSLRRELLAVERQELLRLRDEGRIPNRVVLEVEHDLDLEESRLDSRPFQSPADVG
jgi:CPA1 family monovalent cation:H+ antiporter